MKKLCYVLFLFILVSGIAARQANEATPAHSPGQAMVKDVWTIGIYTGSSPIQLSEPRNVKNPVLTPADVTDFPVDIVAHPFMVIAGSRYYLFFTAKNDVSGQVSGIGLAETSSCCGARGR